MSKRVASGKYVDQLQNKLKKVIKKQKYNQDDDEKTPPSQSEPIKYEDVQIKSMQFRIGFISRDMHKFGLKCVIKYKADTDKVQDRMMKEAIANSTEGARLMSRFAAKYGKKKNSKKTSGDDDDDDDEDEDEDPVGGDGGDDDDDDDDDDAGGSDKAIDDDDEIVTLTSQKGMRTNIFMMFVPTSVIPIHSIYAMYTCQLKEGVTRYPPMFEDIVITRIENKYVKLLSVSKVIADLSSTARSFGDIKQYVGGSMSIHVSRKGRSSAKDGVVFTDLSSLLLVITTPEIRRLCIAAFRDVFRCEEFYWLSLFIPSLARISSDEECTRHYTRIHETGITPYAFASYLLPVSLRDMVASEHVMASCHLAYGEGGTGEGADNDAHTTVVTREMLLANDLWVFLRTVFATFQGRAIWRLNDSHLVKLKMTVEDKDTAVAWLVDNKHLVRDSADPENMVPMQMVRVYRTFMRECDKLKDAVFFGLFEGSSVDMIGMFSNLFGADERMTKTTYVCPTMQSRDYHDNLGDSVCILADSLSSMDDRGLRKLTDNAVLVFAEMHLYTIKHLADATKFLVMYYRQYAQRSKTRRLKIVFSGNTCSFTHQSPMPQNCMFYHLYHAETLPVFFTLTRDTVCDHITPGDLEQSAIDVVMIKKNVKLRTLFLPDSDVSVDNASSVPAPVPDDYLLDSNQVDEVALLLGHIIADTGRMKRPFFLFENNQHMKQIVAHSLVAHYFHENILRTGDLVTEADGGDRRLLELVISDTSGNMKTVQSIDTDEVPHDLIFYTFTANNARGYKTKPITKSTHACIQRARKTPIDMDYVAVFTAKSHCYFANDMNIIAALAQKTLTILTVRKRTGTFIQQTRTTLRSNIVDIVNRQE